MKTEIATTATMDTGALANLILRGDLKALTPEQKVQYYNAVCDRVGLDPVARPFAYMTLSGREVLYCDKGGAEQLRKLHKVSLRVTDRQRLEDVYVVTCEASLPDGRIDGSTGAVSIAGLKGDALANALMKAETKAKRRATLSILGLGMLDESELESIPASQKAEIKAPVQVAPKPITPVFEAQGEAYSASNEVPDVVPSDMFAPEGGDLGEYEIKIGKKYKGVQLKAISLKELESFTDWLRGKDAEEPLRGVMLETLNTIEAYVNQMKSLPA